MYTVRGVAMHTHTHTCSTAVYVLIILGQILTRNGEEAARPMAPTRFHFNKSHGTNIGLHSVFYFQAKSPTQLALWNIRTWPPQSVATANRRHRTRPIPQRLVTQCLSVRRSDALHHDRNFQKGAAVWRQLLDRVHCRIANCNGPRLIVCISLHHTRPSGLMFIRTRYNSSKLTENTLRVYYKLRSAKNVKLYCDILTVRRNINCTVMYWQSDGS